MKTIKTQLKVGAEKPFQILHITDTHLMRADERDCARKVELAKSRKPVFPHTEEVFSKVCKLAQELKLPLIHTGDLMDFVSVKNLETVKKFTEENDVFMAAGTHDFSLFMGEAFEDATYRNQSLATVQKSFTNDIRASSRLLNGVNFVALDNGYYLFDEMQFAFLKNEAKKGYPIVLALHVPLFEEDLFHDLYYHREKFGMRALLEPCSYLAGVPEHLMKDYAPRFIEQQKADKLTEEMIAYIKAEPLIKAVLCGHVHCDADAYLKEGVPQIITGMETARIIQFT